MKATLAPIVHRESYVAPIERELIAYLDETIFAPLRDAGLRFNEKKDENHSVLWNALMAGIIWYSDGVFSGQFNALISREIRALGARRRGDNFALPQEEIPILLRGAIAASIRQAQEVHRVVLATLDTVAENAAQAPTGLRFEKPVDNIVNDLQTQFVSSVEGLVRPTPVSPDFAATLRAKTTEDLDRAIKNFTGEQVSRLREIVRQNFSEGARTDRLSKLIEVQFGVAKRKARFLADQETSLLVSDFRKRRYQELGSKEYIWETSGDEKVRPTHGESNNHRVLNGRKFAWDAPPVVDTATGRRCHPGEDFGPCRCVARPILNILAADA